jgi:Oxidoreductase molybdopterin binding domain
MVAFRRILQRGDDWKLVIEGVVDRPQQWTLRDLQDKFESETVTAVLECGRERSLGLLSTEPRDFPTRLRPSFTSTATSLRIAAACLR